MPKNLKFEDGSVYTNIGVIGIDTVEGVESRWVPIDEALDHVDLERIGISENGVYTGAFSEVTVNVQNAIGTKRITRNGTFHASDDNLDGYSDVTVNVPINYDPNVGVKHISANGTYNASSDNLDGFNRVFVNVQPNVSSKSISSNGTYTASSENKDGYSEVTVNVQPNVSAKTITENGTYTASSDGKDGYSEVTVDINADPDLMTKSINTNGTYSASSDNVDGYSEVTVNVQPVLQAKSVTQNGTVTPDSGYYGMSSVVVNVPSGGGGSTVDLKIGDVPAVLSLPTDTPLGPLTSYNRDFIIPMDGNAEVKLDLTQPFEICCRFKLGTAPGSTGRNIWGSRNSYYHCPAIAVSSSEIICYITTNGSSWNYSAQMTPSGYSLPIDTWITARMQWDGHDFTMSVNDGTDTYTATVANVAPYYNSNYTFEIAGQNRSGYSICACQATVDLANTYLRQNGTIIWGVMA